MKINTNLLINTFPDTRIWWKGIGFASKQHSLRNGPKHLKSPCVLTIAFEPELRSHESRDSK